MNHLTPPFSPLAVWNEFVTAFGASLDETGEQRLLTMWKSIGEKTSFYAREFMPLVAEKLGCVLEAERFRCDFTFMHPEGVPLMFVETENAHHTAGKEVADLCCVAAPLKVLVVSCEWHDSERATWLPRWQEIIRKHHAFFPMNCIYGIVVGEWGRGKPDDDILRYYFVQLDSRGELIGETEWTLGTVLED